MGIVPKLFMKSAKSMPILSNRSARSERKRASDVSSNTIDESESTSGVRIKTRRRE
ncbi:hypothetical protein WUBG_17220 [Wuchereria bancrofti]|uniref:Uncharacterized protein n=1 Tax=Wuchereria bancrofti TaxID=6293 RepID=J9E4H7_WUCBA|nr:hypothetical protein WUBG_17220 [Wuchereria bancrofti]